MVDGAGLIACMMYRFESYCSRQLRGLDFYNQGIEMFDGTITKNNRTIYRDYSSVGRAVDC